MNIKHRIALSENTACLQDDVCVESGFAGADDGLAVMGLNVFYFICSWEKTRHLREFFAGIGSENGKNML